MTTPRHWLPALLSAGVLVLLAACAPGTAAPTSGASRVPGVDYPIGGPAEPPATPLRAVIDAARREGSLSVTWAETSLGGAEGLRRLTDGMNKLYGLQIEMRFTPGPSMSNMAAKIMQEVQTERAPSSDMFVGYANHLLPMIQAGVLEPVDWASWAPSVQDPRLTASEGTAVTVQSGVQGITYNTDRLRGSAVPRTMQDLLKPEYKGRIAGQQAAAGFDRLATPEMWGEQRTLDYLARFKDQIAGIIGCTEQERLLTGEFDLFALECSHANAYRLKARGAPLEYVVPSDAAIVALQYLAIPRTTAHPNAAKLWINYLLSREGQDLLYGFRHEDSHLVPGSKTAEVIKDLEAAGQLKLVDMDFYQRYDPRELSRLGNAVQQMLRTQ
jgi:iron(III) transport system substrate-binding protein